MSFQNRLRERREALAMSRQELGDRLSVTASAISNYENGISTPKADILFRVFDALDCDANYLFQDEMQELKIKSMTWIMPLAVAYASKSPEIQIAICKILDIPHLTPPEPTE